MFTKVALNRLLIILNQILHLFIVSPRIVVYIECKNTTKKSKIKHLEDQYFCLDALFTCYAAYMFSPLKFYSFFLDVSFIQSAAAKRTNYFKCVFAFLNSLNFLPFFSGAGCSFALLDQ